MTYVLLRFFPDRWLAVFHFEFCYGGMGETYVQLFMHPHIFICKFGYMGKAQRDIKYEENIFW